MTSLRAVLALALTAAVALAAAPFDPDVARRITPQEVQRRTASGEKVTVLDTRAAASDAVIHGAVRVPNDKIEQWAKSAKQDDFIVAYCT